MKLSLFDRKIQTQYHQADIDIRSKAFAILGWTCETDSEFCDLQGHDLVGEEVLCCFFRVWQVKQLCLDNGFGWRKIMSSVVFFNWLEIDGFLRWRMNI